ncbi:MAG: biotin transporter BioY [Ruminococcaceae bacterium]|nr:biotin transporter BioY [Oscillospiraceae bacterium]
MIPIEIASEAGKEQRMNGRRTDTVTMAKTALCVAVLCAASYFVIPIPMTPIVLSLHTVAVNVAGLLLRPREAAIAILLYIGMGVIGLPVFAAGTAGPDKLFGPSGGFYFGFLFAAVCISLLKGKKPSFLRHFLVTALVGLPVQHFFAVLFLCFYNGFHIPSAFLSASLPFLPGDILKCILAAGIALKINNY